MMRFVTAGESHGKQLTIIVEGLPAGLPLAVEDVNAELARRQQGYGRGARMKIEKDAVEFVGGVRLGETIGAPVCMVIRNYDWQNWQTLMGAAPGTLAARTQQVRPRPGHADLSAAIKYDRRDIRDILERASARETAARVAAGAVAKRFLEELGVEVGSFVSVIGGIEADLSRAASLRAAAQNADRSPVRTVDGKAEKRMMEAIAAAEAKGDTLGGIFTVVASGVPVGLGSHVQWDQKLDARVARALMSIQAIKGVSFGIGFGFGHRPGSQVHDELFHDKKRGYFRSTNNAGGFEGGITNGEDIVANCVMKPIPSLKRPLKSVNLRTRKPDLAEAVRSDVCAVPAAGVIGEAAVAFELAAAAREKFGGDSLREVLRAFDAYRKHVREF